MKAMMIGVLIAAAIMMSGCGSDLATGIGIGAGSSGALTEAERLTRQSKVALAAEVLNLQAALKASIDPIEVAELKSKIVAGQRKQEFIAIAETVSSKAVEGLSKDWTTKDPEKQRSNIMWLVDMGLLAALGWQTRKRKGLEKGNAKFAAEADPEVAKKLFADTNKYLAKPIP